MIFSIVAMATTIALFTAITATYKVAGIIPTEHIKGYYAAIAGLRYANILLQDHYEALAPIGNSGTFLVDKFGNLDYPDSHPALYADLMMQPPHQMYITITHNADDTYTATASYSL